MIAAILAALQSIPALRDILMEISGDLKGLIGAIEAHTKAVTDASITKAQKDMNNAKSAEEISKAADETAAALGRF